MSWTTTLYIIAFALVVQALSDGVPTCVRGGGEERERVREVSVVVCTSSSQKEVEKAVVLLLLPGCRGCVGNPPSFNSCRAVGIVPPCLCGLYVYLCVLSILAAHRFEDTSALVLRNDGTSASDIVCVVRTTALQQRRAPAARRPPPSVCDSWSANGTRPHGTVTEQQVPVPLW